MVRARSRDSVFHYKGKDADAQVAGRELAVRAIFKGRVMQRGDTLEISAELVDARDNSHIWGQQYSRKSSDIFALQGELAKEMTTALRMRLTGEDEKRMTKSYAANPEAYQDYLRGRYWWNKFNEEGLNKGIEYFRQAIALESVLGAIGELEVLRGANMIDAWTRVHVVVLVASARGWTSADLKTASAHRDT